MLLSFIWIIFKSQHKYFVLSYTLYVLIILIMSDLY